MPPPRTPILPRMSCSIAMVRMFCEPLECWVQPSAYIDVMVLVFDERLADHLATFRNLSFGVPQMRSTSSGVKTDACFFSKLPYAARMLQRVVGEDVSVRPDVVVPCRTVVVALGLVVAGKQPVGVAKAFFYEIWRIGERLHILPLHLVVLHAVADHSEQKRDVGALADRRIEVGHRRGTRETWVDDDQLGAAVGLRLGHPFEAARMRFGGIAAHDDSEIGILDVGPGIRHRSTAECWGQTGHRRAVSDTCLIIERQHPGAADNLVGRPRRLIAFRRSGKKAGSQPTVDRHTVAVFSDKILVAIVFHQPGDTVECVIP